MFYPTEFTKLNDIIIIKKCLFKYLHNQEYMKKWINVQYSGTATTEIRRKLNITSKSRSGIHVLVQSIYEDMFKTGEFTKVVRITDKVIVIRKEFFDVL